MMNLRLVMIPILSLHFGCTASRPPPEGAGGPDHLWPVRLNWNSKVTDFRTISRSVLLYTDVVEKSGWETVGEMMVDHGRPQLTLVVLQHRTDPKSSRLRVCRRQREAQTLTYSDIGLKDEDYERLRSAWETSLRETRYPRADTGDVLDGYSLIMSYKPQGNSKDDAMFGEGASYDLGRMRDFIAELDKLLEAHGEILLDWTSPPRTSVSAKTIKLVPFGPMAITDGP